MRNLKHWLLLFSAAMLVNYGMAQPGANDPTFNPSDNGFGSGIGFGESANVNAVIIQPDGKILVGGDFSSFNTYGTGKMIRLNEDGSQDFSYQNYTAYNNPVLTMDVYTNGNVAVGGGFTFATGGRIQLLNSQGQAVSEFNTGTSFNSTVQSVKFQSDGKIIVAGSFTSYNGTSYNRIIRLNANGTIDAGFTIGSGFNNTVNKVILQTDGKIIVCGSFSTYNGTSRNRIARLNVDGSLDLSFNPGTGFNNSVSAIVLQSDGKLVVAGSFTSFNSVTRNHIVRLNSDGTLDTSFNSSSGFGNGFVNDLQIQTNGRIIAVGNFSAYRGSQRNRIVRININGGNDNTFDPGLGYNLPDINDIVNYANVKSVKIKSDGNLIVGGQFSKYNGILVGGINCLNTSGAFDLSFNPQTAANSTVSTSIVDNNGSILIGGSFTSYNGIAVNRIARVLPSGALDTEFNTGSGFDDNVNTIATQPDGKILVGGRFTNFNGTGANRITRLNSDGSIDNSFNIGTGASYWVEKILIQNDGKIVIGGHFSHFNGTERWRIARLNADGSLDLSFNPGGGFNNNVLTLAQQNDGKILVGGFFTTCNGVACNRIVRLNIDGSIDSAFIPGTGANNGVRAAIIQQDGKILIGGQFTSYNGTARNRIARLNSDGSVDDTFSPGSGFVGVSFNEAVFSLQIQPDGKIIACGGFNTYNGVNRKNIARINTNGSLDETFDPGTGFSGISWADYVSTMSLLSNGKIICGGFFHSFNGIGRNYIAQLIGDNICQTVEGTDEIASCTPITWIDGITYNASNNSATHLMAGGAASGCDSLVTLNLTITPSLTPTFNTLGAFCQGATIPALPTTSLNGINGSWSPAIDNQQTMNYAFTPHGGQCATPTTMTVEILPIITGVHTIASCTPITWIDGITYNASNNTATHLLAGAAQNGCDSLVTLNLTILPCAQLTPTFCGASNVGWNSDVQAIHVAGAQSYRFRIVGNNIGNTWANNTAIHFNNDRVFRFSEINGTYWGQTYQVDVAVSMNGVDYGPYNTVCSVTLENIPSPSMSTTICSSGAASGGTNVSFTTINGALGYRFRIVGNNTTGWPGNTLEFNSASNSFQFNNIPGIIWGQSYAVSAAILSQDGVTYGNYGPACSLTFSFPTTALLPTSCGITGVGLNTVLRAGGNASATGYLFRITGVNTANWANGSYELHRSNRSMRFSDILSGVVAGQTYQIEVAFRAQDGVTYGPFGALCSVTLSNVLMQGLNPDGEINTSLFEVASSHNPFTESFGLQVVTDKIDEWVYITIYDMSGKQIETKQVAPLDIENIRFGQNLASGMYMIEVRQGANQAVIRQVKN